MLGIESPADRAGLFYDAHDLALFVDIEFDEDFNTLPMPLGGPVTVSVERNVRCLFDRPYQRIGEVETFHPVALCLDEDVTYLQQGRRLMLKGHVWEVDERMPDGTGFTQLLLKKVGRYRYDEADVNVAAGLPYTLPIVLGGYVALTQDDPGTDPDNPRLRYPYTVATYLDWNPGNTRL